MCSADQEARRGEIFRSPSDLKSADGGLTDCIKDIGAEWAGAVTHSCRHGFRGLGSRRDREQILRDNQIAMSNELAVFDGGLNRG